MVLYHTLQASLGEHAITAWPNGSAGVDLFFVISGYVMVGAGAGQAPSQFLVRRARRIVPLYWLLTAAKLAVTALAPTATPHTRPTAWNVVGSFMFIPARDAVGLVRPVLPVGWSLNFEVLFYALFAACLALRLRPLWLGVPLGALAVAGYFRAPGWPAPLMLTNGMVLEFWAGMALAGMNWRSVPRAGAWLLGSGAVALLALPLAGPWRWLVWGLPAACVLAGALALQGAWGARVPRWVLAVGDASYAIYLVHPFVVGALAGRGVWGAVAAVGASVVAGVWVHMGVDKPLQRWLAGIEVSRAQHRIALPRRHCTDGLSK